MQCDTVKILLTIQSIKLLQKSVNLYETQLRHIPRDGSAYAHCRHRLIAYETSNAVCEIRNYTRETFFFLFWLIFSTLQVVTLTHVETIILICTYETSIFVTITMTKERFI